MSIDKKLVSVAENVPKVFDAGKKAEYNEFWSLRDYTTTGDWMFAGRFWTKKTFKPTKDIWVSASTFCYHNWLGTPYDLAAHLEELGVKLIIQPTAITQSFNTAWFSRLPVLDFSNTSGFWDRTFSGPSNSPLATIDKIILPPEGKVTTFSNVFQGQTALKNITFEGVIDKSISFSYCPLTVESMKNIALCLKDFTPDVENHYKCTITVKASAFTELEAEGATAEYNGIACTWAELIDNKKWNLTQAS